MIAMDHPTLLTRLIDEAERAIQMRAGADAAAVSELVDAIHAECQKPAERERAIGEEIMLCASAVLLAGAELRGYDRRRAAIFLRVVGVLLPEVRLALALAIEQRKRPMA